MVSGKMLGAIFLPDVGAWIFSYLIPTPVDSPNITDWYDTIKKPRWNPPNWLYGLVWTFLYAGMGYASYMVYKDCGGFTEDAVMPFSWYGGQLLLNWTWRTVFLKYQKIGLAFCHMLALDAAAAACAVTFFFVNKMTAFFMTPYLCWLSFMTYLNYTYWRLNYGRENEIKKMIRLKKLRKT